MIKEEKQEEAMRRRKTSLGEESRKYCERRRRDEREVGRGDKG